MPIGESVMIKRIDEDKVSRHSVTSFGEFDDTNQYDFH